MLARARWMARAQRYDFARSRRLIRNARRHDFDVRKCRHYIYYLSRFYFSRQIADAYGYVSLADDAFMLRHMLLITLLSLPLYLPDTLLLRHMLYLLPPPMPCADFAAEE